MSVETTECDISTCEFSSKSAGFDPEQEDELLEAFTFYDKNGDGLINTKEIGTVMRALGQVLTVCEETDIVAEFAIDQCSEIDFKTFRTLVKKRMREFDEDDELRESFKRFDKEGTGMIEVELLRTMLTTLGDCLTEEEVEAWLEDGEKFVENGYLKCNSQIDELDASEEDEEVPEEETQPEDEEDDDVDEYGLGERERSAFCAAFTLLDTDGDGVLTPRTAKSVITALSREITQESINDIGTYCKAESCDGEIGMDFNSFYQFLASQLLGTNDESELRNAFQVFGSVSRMNDPVPPGFTDMAELRHYLKHRGLKLTDEEIDYLWNEENYWMLEEKRIETEFLIKKLMEDAIKTKDKLSQ